MQLSIEILDDNDDSEEQYKQYVNILEAQLPSGVVSGILRSIADDIDGKNEKPKQASPAVPPYITSPGISPLSPYIAPGIKPTIWSDVQPNTTGTVTTNTDASPAHDGRGPG